jgi:hypothetical protein
VSNNLFWDAANARLGIGTNTPIGKLHLRVDTDANVIFTGEFQYSLNNAGNAYTNYTLSTSRTVFSTNGAERMRITPGTGNILLGTTTDSGQRLQVQGDAFIKGSSTSSASFGLRIENSAGTNLLRVQNSGIVSIGIGPTDTLTTNGQAILKLNSNNNYWTIQNRDTSGLEFYIASYFGGTPVFVLGDGRYSDSVTINGLFERAFAPVGFSGTYTNVELRGTINQTGGANGITRGLYVNPTITAAADWRSIEWSNNSGWGLYGAGTANNYLGGSLGIGTTSPIAKIETFNNSIYIGGALSMYSNTASDESIFYFRRGRGTLASPTTVTNGDTIGSIRFAVQYNSSVGGYNTNAKIDSIVESSGANLCFYTNSGGIANSTIAERMRLTAAGRLLLGTTTESTFLLDVNGTARVSDNLIVSKNQSLTTNITISNTNSGSSVQCALYLANNLSSLAGAIIKNSSTTTAYKILGSGDLCIYNDSVANNGDISILNDRPAGIIKFAAGGSSTAQLQIETTGKVSYAAATSAKAQINLASGTAPTSPVNGDIWFDGTDLKMRIGGVTKTFTLV